MGAYNSAFILDYGYPEDAYWAYYHKYHTGTLSYTVDTSNLPCACNAKFYLVDFNTCDWNAIHDTDEP